MQGIIPCCGCEFFLRWAVVRAVSIFSIVPVCVASCFGNDFGFSLGLSIWLERNSQRKDVPSAGSGVGRQETIAADELQPAADGPLLSRPLPLAGRALFFAAFAAERIDSWHGKRAAGADGHRKLTRMGHFYFRRRFPFEALRLSFRLKWFGDQGKHRKGEGSPLGNPWVRL